jgi:hypothetical protein
MDNSPLEPTNIPLGNARITRRTFIRRTAGATAITVLALQGFRYQSLAAENDASESLGTVYTYGGTPATFGPFDSMAAAHTAMETATQSAPWTPAAEPPTFYDSYKQKVVPLNPPQVSGSSGVHYYNRGDGKINCDLSAGATITIRNKQIVSL